MLRAMVNCYFITSFVQERNVLLLEETERRLHRLCPSVSAHTVSGDVEYDGVVETLLNRVEGTPDCTQEEEDRILRTVGLRCDTIGI